MVGGEIASREMCRSIKIVTMRERFSVKKKQTLLFSRTPPQSLFSNDGEYLQNFKYFLNVYEAEIRIKAHARIEFNFSLMRP